MEEMFVLVSWMEASRWIIIIASTTIFIAAKQADHDFPGCKSCNQSDCEQPLQRRNFQRLAASNKSLVWLVLGKLRTSRNHQTIIF